jgi:hypothetical protein
MANIEILIAKRKPHKQNPPSQNHGTPAPKGNHLGRPPKKKKKKKNNLTWEFF